MNKTAELRNERSLELRDAGTAAAAGAPERRHLPLTSCKVVRDASGKPTKIVGHAAVFNQLSRPLRASKGQTFREQIMPGAFRDVLSAGGDVLALVGHDPYKVLARSSAGTLTLSEDEQGLAFEITPADTTLARDTMTDIEHGNIRGMSFGFGGCEDSWEKRDGENVRTVSRFTSVGEISVTPIPAYEGTDVDLRHVDAAIAKLELPEQPAGQTQEPAPQKPQPEALRDAVMAAAEHLRATIVVDDDSLVWTCRYAVDYFRYAFDAANRIIDTCSRIQGDLSDDDRRAMDDAYGELVDLIGKSRACKVALDALGAMDEDDTTDAADDPTAEPPARSTSLQLIQRAAEMGLSTARLRAELTADAPAAPAAK